MKLLAYDRSIKATMIVALPYTLLQQKVIKRRRNFVELLEGMRCNEYPEHLSFLSKTKSYYLLVFEKSVIFSTHKRPSNKRQSKVARAEGGGSCISMQK